MKAFAESFIQCLRIAIKSSKWCMIARITLLVLLSILPYVSIYFTKILLNIVSYKAHMVRSAMTILVLIILIQVLTKALVNINAFVQSIHSERIGHYLNNVIMDRASKVNIAFFDSPNYLDTLEVVMSDSSVINMLVWSVFNAIGGIVELLASFVIIEKSYYFVAIILLFFTIPQMWVENKYAKKIYENRISNLSRERQQNYLQSICIDNMYAFDIRCYDIGSFLVNRYKKIWKKCFVERTDIKKRKMLITIGTGSLPLIALMFVMHRILNGIFEGTKTIGDISLYLGVFTSIIAASENLMLSLAEVYEDRLKMKSIDKIEEFGTEETRKGTKIISEIKEIEFRNVSFRYGENLPYVFKNLSFKIRKGEKVCFIGTNGVGKSTIIKLLARFYDVTEGEILINSNNINEYSISSLRRCYSIALQDSFNYAFTLRENIEVGDLKKGIPSDYDIFQIFELVNATGLLKKLQKGNDTYIHRIFQSDAYEPSGGERQKISIAKALYRDSSVLVMDEPTASLDPESEQKLFECIRKKIDNKTVIFTTHRMSVVKLVDCVFVLDKGCLVEKGSHEELLQQEGIYSKIYRYQTAEYGGEK